MAQGAWGLYFAVFAVSVALSLVFTPLALSLAVRTGLLDRPAEGKRHGAPVPYLGGVAMLAAFSLAVAVASLLNPPRSGLSELLTLLGLGLGLGLVGLVDDLRGLGAGTRLVAEVSAAVALYGSGVRAQLFTIELLNLVVTVVWVVGITNAFNLLDNMDGLSAGVAAIGSLSFFTIAAINGQFLVAALAAALAGCALGFLRRNFHPARIYMGDAGSLFLGFLLAYLGVKLRFDAPAPVTFLVPVLVLGVAVLDTTLVTICRMASGRNPFRGGLDHVSHRLVAMGLSVPAAVGLLYFAAAALGGMALVVSRVDAVPAFLLASSVGAVGALLLMFLARVPVDCRRISPEVESLSATEARLAVARLETAAGRDRRPLDELPSEASLRR